MVKVEYRIISGRTVEVRQCLMDVRKAERKTRRRPRIAGNTSLKKIKANEDEAVKQLARELNCNFREGDVWITLKYSDERLPESYEAAVESFAKFLRKLRAIYKKKSGKTLRYVLTTSETSSKDGSTVRLHHHLVMDRVAYELLCELWPQKELTYRILDGRGDYTGIAKYMIQNARKDKGKKKWSCSKGLKKPIITEPEIISEIGDIRAPEDGYVREKETHEDAETGMRSAYLRCVVPVAPVVRGGKVIYPKKPGKKKKGGTE